MAEETQNGLVVEHGSMDNSVVFSAVKPWLVVDAPKANDAVQFYKEAFGAEEVSRVNHPKRKAEQELPLVISAELKLGSYVFVVSDLTDDSAPVKSAVTGSLFCLETEDVESAIAKAVAAGATAEGEISEGSESASCGGRVGKVKDPYGNVWMICSPTKKCADVAA